MFYSNKRLRYQHQRLERRKNFLTDDIKVTRILPDGNSVDTTIANKNEEEFPSLVLEESLIINAPSGKDTKEYPVKVRSDIDLAVSHSRTDSNWTIKIVPNSLDPEVPLDANVEVGEEGEG